MIRLKSTKNLNMSMCEEEMCQDDSTRIWANESRFVELCDLHYSEATR